jgi:hypothetical protein
MQQPALAPVQQVKIELPQTPLTGQPLLQPQSLPQAGHTLQSTDRLQQAAAVFTPFPRSVSEFSFKFPLQRLLVMAAAVCGCASLYALFASGCMRRTCWLLVGKGGLRALFRKCLRHRAREGNANLLPGAGTGANQPIELLSVREQNDGVSPRTQTTYKLC